MSASLNNTELHEATPTVTRGDAMMVAGHLCRVVAVMYHGPHGPVCTVRPWRWYDTAWEGLKRWLKACTKNSA